MEGSLQKAGKTRWLRFGSQAYVSQGLPSSQAATIARACQKQGAEQVISLLVESSFSFGSQPADAETR